MSFASVSRSWYLSVFVQLGRAQRNRSTSAQEERKGTENHNGFWKSGEDRDTELAAVFGEHADSSAADGGLGETCTDGSEAKGKSDTNVAGHSVSCTGVRVFCSGGNAGDQGEVAERSSA